MKKVNLEQARKLKELGFDISINAYYTFSGLLVENLPRKEKMANGKFPTYYAPYIAEALEWIRNEKDIPNGIWCAGEHSSRGGDGIYYEVSYLNKDNVVDGVTWFDTYEEAESALLDELLSILENK